MYPALLLVLVVSLAALALIGRYRRAMRAAQNELYESRQQTQLALRCAEGYKRLLADARAFYAMDSACATMEHQRQLGEQAVKHDEQVTVLLGEIGMTVLERMHAETLAETWKSYALAYEVLCEAAAEKDSAGASNAGAAVAEARRILSALGQYDA